MMTAPLDASNALNAPSSRRDALKMGGLTVSLGALIAACGQDRAGDDAPGRVGEAPAVTLPPDYEVDDVVRLRTASSLEYTAIAVYDAALGLDGVIPAPLIPTIERLLADHRATADAMVELTTQAGGEPWTCPNPWYMDRVVQPVLEAIQSDVVGIVMEDTSMVKVLGEELKIADVVQTSRGEITMTSASGEASAGDEITFTRLDGDIPADVLDLATGLENLAAAAHQELAVGTTMTSARVAHVEAAALEARHAAVLAIVANGGAAGYISPLLVGETDVVPDVRGQLRQFAIGSTFAQTAQIEIKLGPGDSNNVRTSYLLQTPANNSFIYNELESCDG
jgi:hypothetical protein